MKVANVTPAVNQVEYAPPCSPHRARAVGPLVSRGDAHAPPAAPRRRYHIGMGADPGGILSYTKKLGVVLQGYSPLGDGTGELISGPLVSGIGAAHNKTGAQVALHWVVKHGVPVSTKSTSAKHLAADLDIFGWDVSDAELATLDAATSPRGSPSFMCHK